MTNFKVNPKISIKCENYQTKNSWGHKAKLYIDETEEYSTRIRYYNRTWEKFTYASILDKVFEANKNLFTKWDTRCFKAMLKNGGQHDRDDLKTIGMVASLGELLAPDQKTKNDWKTRMIKAGLGNRGLIMPEDWDKLSEDEKEKRLNKVIKELKK